MIKITQYPRSADGTPMDLEVGVLTDSTGNGGARLSTPPIGPDNAPIDAKALVLVDSAGDPIFPNASVTTINGLKSASTEAKVVNVTDPNVGGTFVWRLGNYSAQVAADTYQALFVASNSQPATVGAWVRQYGGTIEAHWTGIVADDATDVNAQIQSLFNVVEAMGVVIPYGQGVPPIHWRAGLYYSSASIKPQQLTKIIGDGTKNHPATYIRFPANTHGFDLRYQIGERSPGIVIQGIGVKGGYTNFASEGAYHGFNIEVSCKLIDCWADTFQGDGFNITASAAPENEFLNNANFVTLEDCWSAGNTHGYYFEGADANSGRTSGCHGNYNRRWALFDNSFLANHHENFHADGNGISHEGVTPVMVSHMGNRFTPKINQVENARVNAPPATGVDSAYWLYCYPGGVSVPASIPAWTNGMALRHGGTVWLGASPNTMLSLYTESGQPPAQTEAGSIIIGGLVGSGHKGYGTYLRNLQGLTTMGTGLSYGQRGLVVEGDSTIKGGLNIQPPDGTALPVALNLNNTEFSSQINMASNGGLSLDAWLLSSPVFGLLMNGTAGMGFRVNNVNIGNFFADGLSLYPGKNYYISGEKVVGARQAAIANATDAASAITQLNLLLAAARTHGLIAT